MSAATRRLRRRCSDFALTRWFSSNITPAALAERGWTAGGLQAFLKTGVAPQGSAFGDMYEVVNLSTRHLDDADIKALTVYLLGEPPPAAPARRQAAVDEGKDLPAPSPRDVTAGDKDDKQTARQE